MVKREERESVRSVERGKVNAATTPRAVFAPTL
jgi:hypothetical protein